MANESATKFWDGTLGGGSYASVSVADALEMQKAGGLLVDARPAGDTAVSTVKGAVPMEEYTKKLDAGELKEMPGISSGVPTRRDQPPPSWSWRCRPYARRRR